MEQESIQSEKLLLNVSNKVDDKSDGCGSDSVGAKCLSDSETEVEEAKKSDLYSDDETCTDGKEKCTHFDDEYEGGDETISNETEQSDDDDSTDEELYKLVKVVSKKRKHSKKPLKRRPESGQYKERAMDSQGFEEDLRYESGIDEQPLLHSGTTDIPMGLESGPDKTLISEISETSSSYQGEITIISDVVSTAEEETIPQQPGTPPKNSSTCDKNPAAPQPLNRQFSQRILLLLLGSIGLLFLLIVAVGFLTITRLYQVHGDLSSHTTISIKGYHNNVASFPKLFPTPSAPPNPLYPDDESRRHPYTAPEIRMTRADVIANGDFQRSGLLTPSPTNFKTNMIPNSDFGVKATAFDFHMYSFQKSTNHQNYKQFNSLTSSTALMLHPGFGVCQSKIDSPTPLVRNNELTDLFISSCKVSSLAKHDSSTTALMVHPDFGVCQRFRSKHHSPMMLVLRLGLAGNIVSLMERICLTKCDNSIALSYKQCTNSLTSSTALMLHPGFGVCQSKIDSPTLLVRNNEQLLTELFISRCKVSSLAKHDSSTTALMVHPDFGVCQRFRSKHHSPMILVLHLGLAGNIVSLMEWISLTKYDNSIALIPRPEFGEFVSSQPKQLEFKLEYSRFHPKFGVVASPINAIPDFGVCQRFRSKHHSPMILVLRLGLAGNIVSLMEWICLTKYDNSIGLIPHQFSEFVSSQLKQFEFKLQYTHFNPNFGVVGSPIMLQSSDVLLSNQTFSDVPVWQRTRVDFEVVHPLPFPLPSSIEVADLLIFVALYFVTCLIKRLVKKSSASDCKKHFNKVGCFNDALPTAIADCKHDPSVRHPASKTTHSTGTHDQPVGREGTASEDSTEPAATNGGTAGDGLPMQDPSSTTDSKQVHSVRDPDNPQPASVEQQEQLTDNTPSSEQLLNGSYSSSEFSMPTSAEIEKTLHESSEVFGSASSVDTADLITCLPRPNEPSTSQPLECEVKPPLDIDSETPGEVTGSPSSLISEIDNANIAYDPPPLPDGNGHECDSKYNAVPLLSNSKENQTDEGYSSLNTEVSQCEPLECEEKPPPDIDSETPSQDPGSPSSFSRQINNAKAEVADHPLPRHDINGCESDEGHDAVLLLITVSEDSTEPAATNGGTAGDSLPMQDPSSTTDSKQVHSVRDPDNPQPASVEQQEQLTDDTPSSEQLLNGSCSSSDHSMQQSAKIEKCDEVFVPGDHSSYQLESAAASSIGTSIASHNVVPLQGDAIEIKPQHVMDSRLLHDDTNFKRNLPPDEHEDNAEYSSKKKDMFMAPTPVALVHDCKGYRTRPISSQKDHPQTEIEAEPPEDPPDPAPNVLPADAQQQANPNNPGQDNNPIPVSQDPEDPSPGQEPLIAAAQVISHHDGNDTPKLILTMGELGSDHPGPVLPDVNEFGSGREQNSVTLQSDAQGIEPHSVMDSSLPDSTGHVPPEDNALSKKKDKSDLVEDDYCSSSIVHGLIITRYQPIQPSSLEGGKPKSEKEAEPPEDPPDPAPNLDTADTQQQAVIGPEQYDNLIPIPQDPLDLAPIQECLNAATQIISHRDENDICIPQPRVCLMGGTANDRPTALSDVKGIGSGRERDAMVLQSDVEAIEPQHILNKSLCDSNDHFKHVPPDKPEDSAKLVSNKDKIAVPIMVENGNCSSSMDVHGFNTYHTLRGGKPKRENVAEPPKDPPDPAPNLDPVNTQQQPLIAAAQVVSHHDGNDTPKLFLTMGGPGSEHPGPVLPDVNEFGSGREQNSMTLQSDAQGIEPNSVMHNSLPDSTDHVPEDNTDSLLKKKDKFAITPVLVEYDNCSSSVVHGLIITRYQPIQPSSLEGGKPKREKEAEPPEDPPDPAPNLVPADAQQQAVLGPGQYDNLIPIPQDPPDLAPLQECLNAATQIVSHRDENDIPQPSVYLMGGPASDRLTALSDFNGIGSGREHDAMVLQSDVEAIEPQRILDKSPNDHFKHVPPDRPEDSANHVSNNDKIAVPIMVENDDCSTYHTLRGGKPKRENVAEPPEDPPDPAPNLDPANAQQQVVLGPGQYGNLPPPDPPVSAPILYVALKIIPHNVTPKLFVAMAGPGSKDLPLPVVSLDLQVCMM